MSEPSFEPAVLALLQEIAKDPRASLLRIPEKPLRRYVGQPEEMLSPHGSYLTKAEKHLVTAYREQAARVLLEACVLKLTEDPLIFSTLRTDERSLGSRAEAVLQRLSPQEEAVEALRALTQGSKVTLSGLAVASLRLAPSELGLNALALAHQQEAHVRTSMRVLQRLFDSASSFAQRAQAWGNLARAHVLCSDFRQAFEVNRRASQTNAHQASYLVDCLTSAVQGGSEESAAQSASQLDRHASGSEVLELAKGLRIARRGGAWSPTRAALRLIPRIRGRLSERSGAVCDAFS